MNSSSEGSCPRARPLAALARGPLVAEEQGVEGRGAKQLALAGARDALDQLVDRLDRIGGGLTLGPLRQRRQLDELEKARDGAVQVGGRVEPHLGKGRARPPRLLEDLVAKCPVSGVKALGGPEELLLLRDRLEPERLADLMPGARGLAARAGHRLRPAEDQSHPGARGREVAKAQPPLVGIERPAGSGR